MTIILRFVSWPLVFACFSLIGGASYENTSNIGHSFLEFNPVFQYLTFLFAIGAILAANVAARVTQDKDLSELLIVSSIMTALALIGFVYIPEKSLLVLALLLWIAISFIIGMTIAEMEMKKHG